jgi:DNA-directed RNA polymerase specialized sigma subunit
MEFDFEKLDKFVRYMVRNVSPHLRDDAYQAAYLGILKAFKNYDPKKSKFITFISSHKFYIENEILKMVAELSLPFSIDKLMFLDIIKHKKGKTKNLSEYRQKLLDRLANTKRVPYDVHTEA